MTKPYPYQLEIVNRICRFNGRALVSLDMGCGKTLVALLYAKRIGARPVVVVCPASVKWHWQREAAKHVGMRAEVLEGMSPDRNGGLSPRAPIIVLNYDILGPWLPHLRELNPQLVVIDESQALQDLRTQRTKNTRELCQGVPNVLALSGTPIINRPKEIWPTLNILRSDLYPSFWKFGFKFCAPKRTFWGWDFRGASNLDELRKGLKRFVMIRKRKEEVLKDLPKFRRIVVPMEIRNRPKYDQAQDDFLGWLAKYDPAKLNSAMRAKRLVQLGYLKRLAARLKMRNVLEWVDDFLADTDDKLVVFAVHRKIIKRLRDRYAGMAVVVDGSVTGRTRQLAIDQFQKFKKKRMLIGQGKAAGTGIGLTAATATAFVELAWNPGTHTQAEARTLRIGQDRPVTYWYLVARDTIEEKLLKISQDKQKVLTAAMDGGKGEDFDVFDRLCEALKESI